MSVRRALLAALSAPLLSGVPVPAAAAEPIHLVVSVDPPRFGDQDDLIYQVRVTNLGPGRATGMVARQSVLLCPSRSAPPRSCQRDTDLVFAMSDLARGGRNTFAVMVFLRSSAPVVVRNTVEMLKADQRDSGSPFGLCQDGSRPQAACSTRVTEVR